MATPWRVLTLAPFGKDLVRGLFEPLGDAVELLFPESRDEDGLLAVLPDAELVIGDFTGLFSLDKRVLEAAPHLAFVQTPSVGTDSVDVDMLAKAGVPVANAAGANARGVAEWALGAALVLCRHLAWADRGVRAGGWPQRELLARNPREIHTQRVGIVGYGAIGSETARLFEALGAPVSYWSRRRRPEASATYRELDDLLAVSDILVLTLPLTPDTRGLLDARRLALLPDRALLVNVGRGGVVADDVVAEALESGRLGGAALDVYEQEPLPPDHPLRSREDVLLSPHGAGGTGQAQINIVSAVRDNITAAVTGKPVANVVNGVDPLVRRR
ncbi:3-phosphoglycerate dehydrogenase [Actinomadura sp. NBRC 104412]|uniref:NAD(P)-dependent oxidoreductase n=1 Tax=Actinomadura sp. NBRC 104412 TaxID=3032203 RepID=UPI0024A10421|nr:NAD(P)-dependent oxidoreductase [Actinomadura sp. NBRC 104412]GLZ08653.1 3-phosphoglycerate dehydrogenase [Actinomadura sp. NBRC 104412]